jgi:hypothetical protein
MSRAGQIAIGNRNAERFLQPTQQPSPPTGLQPTAELQDYLAKNGIPNRIDPNTGQLLIGKAADAYSRPEASQRPLGPLGASAQPTPQGPPPRMGVDPGKVAEAVATKTAEAPIEQESKYQQGLITQNLKLRESILADATAARANSANIDRFMQLNKDPNVAKGRFAETFSGLKNAAASFGVDVKGLPAEQAMQSISSQMALQLRNPASGGGMPGAMSDSDRNFLTAMTPSLAQSKEGRELVAETFQAVNNRNVEVSRMLLKHEMDGGKVDSAFLKKLADHADKNPIFGEEQQKKLAQIMEAPTAPAAPKVTGMTRNYHIDNIIKNGSPEDIQKLRDRGLIQ